MVSNKKTDKTLVESNDNALKSFIRNITWIYKLYFNLVAQFHRHDFDHLEYYCMFIGYPRSGHSLIGALLDAHPEIAIGMEANVFKLIKKGFNRTQILTFLVKRSQYFATRFDYTWTNYRYKIQDLWQGKYEKLKVIGDKKGGRSSYDLTRNQNLIDELEEIINLPLKMIHVVRNPFDTISTILIRRPAEKKGFEDADFDKSINYYFSNAKTNFTLMQKYKEEIHTLHHEEFIANPSAELQNLLLFLNLEPTPEYLEKCAAVVNMDYHKSRHKLNWPNSKIDKVLKLASEIPFLKNYTWEN